jgi:fructose-1,6-bisphosphatase II
VIHERRRDADPRRAGLGGREAIDAERAAFDFARERNKVAGAEAEAKAAEEAPIAEAFGRNVNDITTIVLDRPRHHDLIEEIRSAGARIKLIQDGDVTASISAAVRGTNDHLAIGIGGTRQAVLSAAALRCLGGELQAQLWPMSRQEIEEAAGHGIDDVYRVFRTEDLAPGEVIVTATGVSNGDLLRGVRFYADSARSHSLVMCTRCNWVRFVDGIHFFARERREEVRLLGF